jgi:bifunctional non-homologous end joining protein LigD
MSLERYRSKRDAARTPEPVPAWDVPGALDHDAVAWRSHEGPQDGRGNTFVVQEHHATALHWDVRLERDGVLVSWAVPKGLPLDPKQNHLAKQTEDHPMGYATFEGSIPKGQYGGGSVTVWDSGTYELEKWTDREVKVVLTGKRVQGRYVFFRTRGDDWMVHRMGGPPTGWSPLPTDVTPMLATTGTMPRAEDRWAFEVKWDGVRALIWVDGGRLTIRSRNGNDVTSSYPELRPLGLQLGSRQVLLDGEIVALTPEGRSDFGTLQARMHVATPSPSLLRSTPVQLVLFDVLHLEGESLLARTYDERRAALESLGLRGDHWQVPDAFHGHGSQLLEATRAQGLEGIVAKKRDSTYLPGRRSDCWLKLKHVKRASAVIAGWKPGEGGRAGRIGSLLLGVYGDEGLVYAGHVGTGFSAATLASLGQQLEPMRRSSSPFDGDVPRQYAKDAVWVEPRLVAEVEYTEWTKDGRLRHPSYKGLREDISPEEVTRGQEQ